MTSSEQQKPWHGGPQPSKACAMQTGRYRSMDLWVRCSCGRWGPTTVPDHATASAAFLEHQRVAQQVEPVEPVDWRDASPEALGAGGGCPSCGCGSVHACDCGSDAETDYTVDEREATEAINAARRGRSRKSKSPNPSGTEVAGGWQEREQERNDRVASRGGYGAYDPLHPEDW